MTPAEYRARAAELDAQGDHHKAAGQRAAATKLERRLGAVDTLLAPFATVRPASRAPAYVPSARIADLIADVPTPVYDGGYARAGAGIRADGRWDVYFLVGTERRWLDLYLTGSDCISAAKALNARAEA